MKRPWNISNSSVYSLMTMGEKANFNICTYVTAVSMKPKMYAIAIDYLSQTFENLKKDGRAVLQVLSQNQKSLILPLGKRSGKNFDKVEYLNKRNELSPWENFLILKNSAALIKLSMVKTIDFGGDHALLLFRVEKSKTLSETNVLDFQTLIKEKIIL